MKRLARIEQMALKTEYLVIVDRKEAFPFYNLCETPLAFFELISKDQDISVSEGGSLEFKQDVVGTLTVTTEMVEGKEQRYFHVEVLLIENDEDSVSKHTSALRAIRKILIDSGAQVETLSNEVSEFYSTRAYPILHSLENRMRKLISYFMFTRVGKEWLANTLPKEVKDALDKSKRGERSSDPLYRLDFKHLGDFLFNSYSTKNINQLLLLIAGADDIADLQLSDLKEFQRKSNWERYFSAVVHCEDTYLSPRWSELYELRCLVAHNNLIGKTEYERILTLAHEVGEVLATAISNISEVEVPEEEKEAVLETAVSTINDLVGRFITDWRHLESELRETLLATEIEQLDDDEKSTKVWRKLPIFELLSRLRTFEVLDLSMFDALYGLSSFRNALVHGELNDIEEADIQSKIKEIALARWRLSYSIEAVSWKDRVVHALTELNGEGHISEIYDAVQRASQNYLPPSWKASVRKTLQLFSSDSPNFAGKEDLFIHISEARWGLRPVS